jgi:hypothetical protein
VLDCLAKYLKNASKNISAPGVFYNKSFQWAFDDNVSVIHVFIKHILKTAEQAEPPPPYLCAGGGSFQPKAVS